MKYTAFVIYKKITDLSGSSGGLCWSKVCQTEEDARDFIRVKRMECPDAESYIFVEKDEASGMFIA